MKTSYTTTTTFIISSALVRAAFSQSLNSVPQLKPSPLSQSQSMEAAHLSQSTTLEVTDSTSGTETIEDSNPEGIHWGDSGAWGEWVSHHQDRNDGQLMNSNTGRIEDEAGMDSKSKALRDAAQYRERLSSNISDEQQKNSNTGLIEGQDGDLVIPTDHAGVSTRPGGLTSPHGNLRVINDNKNPSGNNDEETNNSNSGPIEGQDGDLVIPTDDAGVSTRPGGLASPHQNIQFFDDNETQLDREFDRNDCATIEQAIGIGAEFGVAARCECSGDFGNNNMAINCAFDGCAPGTEACGYVVQNFAFGEPNGIIETSVCTTFDDTNLEETCIHYEIDVRERQNVGVTTIAVNNSGKNSQTCKATYGGEQCGCSIETNNCLSVDCTSFLPGAKIDNCQLLSMDVREDTEHWIPNFEIFQPMVLQLEESSEITDRTPSSESSRGRAVGLTTVAMAAISLVFGQFL